MPITNRRSTWAATALMAGLMAACGGGGGGGGDATLTGVQGRLTGLIASRSALGGAAVNVRCVSGNASTTAAGDGVYTADVGGSATFPCLVRATSGSTTLHSVVATNGPTQTVNVTPVTELIVANVTDQTPATAYDNLSAGTAAGITAGSVATATTQVNDTLTAAGVTADTNALSGTPSSTTLTQLDDRLTGTGTTLPTLTSSVVASSPAAGSSAPSSGTVSLPPAQLLATAATNCAGLRSGRYRSFTPSVAGVSGEGDPTSTFTLNASTLTVTYSDNSTDSLTAAGNCRFNIGSEAQFAVSAAGVSVATGRDQSTTPFRVSLSFPEQTIPVADLAGDWNSINFDRASATASYVGDLGQMTINASGAITAGSSCVDLQPCTANAAPFPSFSANSAGGFNLTGGNEGPGIRAFAYRAGNGDLALFIVDPLGAFSILTKQRVHQLPTVNANNSNWNVSMGVNGQAPATLTENLNTITSVNTTAGSWVRTNQTDGHTETFLANVPRNGYLHRPGGSSPNNTGGTTAYSDAIFIQLRGLGVSVGIRNQATSTNGFFNFSVAQ